MATIRKLRGRWQAQVRRRGMAPRAKSFDAKADAERWARQLETEIDRSGLMQDTRLAETTTLSSVLERYLIEVTPRKRSAKSETSRLRSICRLPLAHRTLATLTSADIAAYRDQRLKEVSPASVIREVNNLSHAIDYAIRDWGIYLPSNPCKLVRRPSPPKGRMRRLRDGEEQRLLDGTKNGGRNLYMHDIIILAIETGMRRSELLGLDWKHIDLVTGVAHLPDTKNGDPRDVPLSTRARAVLQGLWETQGEPREGRALPTSESAVHQAWGHLCGRVGIEDLHFHDLRHEAVSRLFELGLNVVEVSTISGHKELRMLQRYTHLKASDLVARLG